MAKLLLAVLIILLVGFGLYFFVFPKEEAVPSSLNQTTSQVLPEPDATSEEENLTALDKELLELENSEASFSEELNNI